MIGFSTLDVDPNPTYYDASPTNEDALGLLNPDSVLSGTNRGTQNIGGPNLQIDNTIGLITVKSAPVNGIQQGVFREGQVAQNFLGIAIGDAVADTMFAGRDATGKVVIKIAKAGLDAKTATPDQLIFSSDRNIYSIVKDVPISLTIVKTSSTTLFGSSSVAHGLTYLPKIDPAIVVDPTLQALSSGGTIYHTNPALTYGTVGTAIALFSLTEVTVDNTNVYLATQLSPSVPNGTYNFSAVVTLQQKSFM